MAAPAGFGTDQPAWMAFTPLKFEHVARQNCVDLLRRVRTWLKPGGVLRIVLPDLRLLADKYASAIGSRPIASSINCI
jgi:predicted SAM-dependent methyltransferase